MLEQEVLTNMTLIIRCSSYDSFLMFTMITFCSIYACSINTQKKNCFWIQREQKSLSSIWNCYLRFLLSPYSTYHIGVRFCFWMNPTVAKILIFGFGIDLSLVLDIKSPYVSYCCSRFCLNAGEKKTFTWSSMKPLSKLFRTKMTFRSAMHCANTTWAKTRNQWAIVHCVQN